MINKINKFINNNRDEIVSAAPIVSSAFGIKQGTVGQTGSAIGSFIPGPAGAAVQVASQFAGTGDHRTVNELTGEIEGDNGTGIIGGIQKLFGWGRSTNSLINKQNRIKTSLADQQLTQDLNYNFYSDPNNSVNGSIFATAAEGGIMRRPVDALVSKGELIYNPMTKKLSKVPGSKGKPNKADDVYARLYEGDVVISNSPTMLMANGKTPAQNLEGLVDKYATGGTVKAREAIIKKVVNWQEANKTKPQQYAKFDEGVGNVESADDVSFDKDMYAHMLLMLPMINTLNFDRYNAMQNAYAELGFTDTKPGNNIKKDDKVAAYQKLYDELTFGNDRINQMRKEGRIKGKGGSADKPETWNDGLPGTQTWLRHFGKNLSEKQMSEINSMLSSQGLEAFINDNGMVNYRKIQKPLSAKLTPYEVEINETIDEDPIPDAEKWVQDPQDQYKKGMRKLKLQKIKNSLGELGETISDLAPLASALFGDYDYHREQPYINPAKYIPTGVSIEPIRRAANESYAMARYNQTNLNPNTGVGMAYGLQAASNRAKTLADAYTWQQDAQNKLIAQNVGIYNDWAKRYDAARYQAIADTRANEGAAQQMRDSAIRDAYEFVAGRRNDDMLTAMLKPMFEYGTPDEAYRQIYKRRIV